MSTVTITLPDDMKSMLEKQSAEKGYDSLSEYLQDIVRALQEFQPDAEVIEHLARADVKSDLEQKLLEGLNSPGIIVDERFWESRQQALRAKYPHLDFDLDLP